MLYVGETGHRLVDHFDEHQRPVKGYNQNPRYQGSRFPVGEHFNLPDHTKIQDTRVAMVRRVQGGTATRQCEMWLIIRLGTLAPRGLNIEFKFH